MRALCATLFMGLFLYSIPAKADSVYTYTGHNFDVGCTTCSISGWFAVAVPLAPDLDGSGGCTADCTPPIIPDSFSFTDNGGVTITSLDAASYYL